ncbi:MAG: transposase, partial [Bacteroidota bacterium]
DRIRRGSFLDVDSWGAYKLSDFESMYSEKGRPPVSPVVLIVILILQYIERLTDRAVANNLRFRLDWKIGLELDYQGIHPTT